MTIAQMQAAAAEGAFIELVYVHTLTIPELKRTANFTISEAAEAIRKIGAASVILSTDMGQVGIALPVDGLASFAAGLRAQGFTNGDLDRMMKENPARLLGLPAPPR
jgi:microsomal dipeptidase-like Zn-dependent dipeptidase